MFRETLTGWCETYRPRDSRSVTEWAEEHVTIPGSARSRKFDAASSPWLREPLNFYGDNRTKEMVVVLPTGAGKTTIFDVCIPHSVSEDPGSILLAMQTDPDAKEHMEDRLMPILKSCEPLAPIFSAMDRHASRKDAIIFPHMSLFCGGANKNNFQRKSVREVFLDEAWLIKHGLIEEARARTHNRWNQRVVIVSQGGDEHIIIGSERRDTELFAALRRTDRREYSTVCPECGEIHSWAMRNLRYEGDSDEREISESARYVCPGRCATPFEDKADVRRQLSTESVYIATNPKALFGHHGWHTPALAMFHETWGSLALGWHRANEAKKGGDNEPLKIFITKRLAEFWKEEEDAPDVMLGASGYTIGDYMGGEQIDGEGIVIGGAARFMKIDRQRDHFWVGVRAWRNDGSSRLLYFGKVLTIEAAREIQLRYKVIDSFVAEDASHMPTEVYDDCAKYGWIAFFGDQVDGFDHPRKDAPPLRKFFSPIKKALAPCGKVVRYIRWSNEKVKDILFNLLTQRGAAFDVPDDIDSTAAKEPERYSQQIRSEVKRDVISPQTKQVSRRYVKTRKHNHAIDIEAMSVVWALIKGLVAQTEDAAPEAVA